MRRVPLLWSDGTTIYPGLSIETLRLALGVKTLVALGDTGGGHTLEGIRIGGFTLLEWMAGIAYPHNIGGRPLNSWPS